MSPDANDASPSPEPEAEHESQTMADLKNETASGEERSPSNTNDKDGSSQPPTKPNAKDPSRPRRKKARRACFACQRAHLTCGDERPCNRCIKRGLQDHCHDGVRKKAKYLHDAPPEALVPGFAGNFVNGAQQSTSAGSAPPPGSENAQNSPPNAFYPNGSQGASFQRFSQPGQMGPPMTDSNATNNNAMLSDFAASQNVETPQFSNSNQVSPVQDMATSLENTPSLANATSNSYDPTFFDPNDPSLFNFNISDLNFENRYGALEFGMLGHMSGAVGTPDVDGLSGLGGQGLTYDSAGNLNNNGYAFNQQNFSSWQNIPNAGSRHGSSSTVWNNQNNGMDAFAIGEQGQHGQSPHSQSYGRSPEASFPQSDIGNQQEYLRQSISHQHQQRQQSNFPQGAAQSDPSRKRRRQTSDIYKNVRAPYSYTQGFHAMTAHLQKRYPTGKVLKIAKALATIRPSFISCNKNLNHDDLVFMEQAFQRQLIEYEDYINHIATPTIICRRTGEIAFASKEFSLVTGWRRDVLLGKEPNLNVNVGGSGENLSGTQTGSSTRGAATPRMVNLEADPARPQPVFLAEILDEDSVVQFYEDFAELAFGSTGSAIQGAPCSLLKYKTKEDPGWAASEQAEDRKRGHHSTNDQALIRGEAGMNALGERDGRVQCMMCWSVRRDFFDIPMMIVMNFLPVI